MGKNKWIIRWLKNNSPHLQLKDEFYNKYKEEYEADRLAVEEDTGLIAEPVLTKTMFIKELRNWYGYNNVEIKRLISSKKVRNFISISELWESGDDMVEDRFLPLKRYKTSPTGSITDIKIYKTKEELLKDYPEPHKYGNIKKAALGYKRTDKKYELKSAYNFKWKIL